MSGEMIVHGRGGQGAVLAAEILATTFVLEGKYAANFPFFGQERRGAPVQAFVRFGSKPIRERTRIYLPDMVVVLDSVMAKRPESYKGLKGGGVVVANAKKGESIRAAAPNLRTLALVDATSIALKEIGRPIPNSCMLGAFAKATGLVRVKTLCSALEEQFKGKSLSQNIRSLERGYEETQVEMFPASPAAEKEPPGQPRPAEIKKGIPYQSSFEAGWAMIHQPLTLVTGEWRLRRPILHESSCRQCGWCRLYCPLGCLRLEKDGYWRADLQYCKGCGLCARECPAYAIQMIPEEVEGN